jgi:hypothetical protein
MVCNSRQVLVQAALAVLSGLRIRADRLGVVEEVEHHGMLFDRVQHVGEAPLGEGADRLALECARAGAPDIALGDGNREVVRPERNQPLDEADRRCAGAREARRGLDAKHLLFERRRRLHRTDHCRHHRARPRRRFDQGRDAGRRHALPGEILPIGALALLLLAILILIDRLQRQRRAPQRGIVGALRRLELGEERFARIAGPGEIAGARAEAEAIERGQEA